MDRLISSAFAPISGDTLSGVHIPENSIAVRLGTDVSITIDGVTLDYVAGEGLVLVSGKEYTFSDSVDVHIMGII